MSDETPEVLSREDRERLQQELIVQTLTKFCYDAEPNPVCDCILCKEKLAIVRMSQLPEQLIPSGERANALNSNILEAARQAVQKHGLDDPQRIIDAMMDDLGHRYRDVMLKDALMEAGIDAAILQSKPDSSVNLLAADVVSGKVKQLKVGTRVRVKPNAYADTTISFKDNNKGREGVVVDYMPGWDTSKKIEAGPAYKGDGRCLNKETVCYTVKFDDNKSSHFVPADGLEVLKAVDEDERTVHLGTDEDGNEITIKLRTTAGTAPVARIDSIEKGNGEDMTQKIDESKLKGIGIERTGERIIVPPTVTLEEAMIVLDRQRTEEERTVNITEEVDGYPMDAAYAFARALKQIYGWTDLKTHTVMSFFGPIEKKPEMRSLEVGVDETVQVPMGRIEIPGINGYLLTSFGKKNGQWIFMIGGEVRKKHLGEVKRIADLTRQLVREESIYKGKAIRLNFSTDPDDTERLVDPTFIDTRKVREEELIFSDRVGAMVDVSLFTPVEHTEACRKHGIPLKRGVLLEGVFGTGKTLTAYVTAKKAVQNGWTFIYLNNVSKLPEALSFARRYQPAVLFAEDVDQAVGEERDEDVNDILNTLDGVENKDKEIICILTTNNVEKIHKALLRPGRLDAVIHMDPPDAAAVEKLIRLYGRGLVTETEDLRIVARRLADQRTIPATIREVVERAKLAAIRHVRDGQMRLTAGDLEVATEGMLSHLALMQPKPEDQRSDTERFADAVGQRMGTALKEAVHASKNGNGGTLGLPPA